MGVAVLVWLGTSVAGVLLIWAWLCRLGGQWVSPIGFVLGALESENRYRWWVLLLFLSGLLVLLAGIVLWLLWIEHFECNGGWRPHEPF